MMRTLTFEVKVTLNDNWLSKEKITEVLDNLINVGLADAGATVESEEGDLDNARIALYLDIHSPKLLKDEK